MRKSFTIFNGYSILGDPFGMPTSQYYIPHNKLCSSSSITPLLQKGSHIVTLRYLIFLHNHCVILTEIGRW